MIQPHAEYFDRQFEQCRTAKITGANHNAQVDNPESIRTQVREFLGAAFDARPATNPPEAGEELFEYHGHRRHLQENRRNC